MAEITEMEIVLHQDELLAAIWYSDGSGARCGIDVNLSSHLFHIHEIRIDGGLVFIKIRPNEESNG